jgi:hypothetical protein
MGINSHLGEGVFPCYHPQAGSKDHSASYAMGNEVFIMGRNTPVQNHCERSFVDIMLLVWGFRSVSFNV